MTESDTRTLEQLVEARTSAIHGTGLFARVPIADGEFIGVYEGEPTDIDNTFVLWVEHDAGDGWYGIDGTGPLRFLNHSCSPNVEFDGPDLYAIRDLAAGDELLFDYGDEWAHVP